MASQDYLSILDDILGKYDYNGIKLPEAQPPLANKQVLGAWGKPKGTKGKLPTSPPSGTVDPKSMASGAFQGAQEMMQVPQAITEQASSDLTGKPASEWAKQGIDTLTPGIQSLKGAIGSLKEVSPKWAEIADAMRDEAETHAAKLGTDPMMYMMGGSKLLSGIFALQSASGTGEAVGQGLAAYDKSDSITPEVGRAAVRAAIQLGMTGLTASHAKGEAGEGIGPTVTFGENETGLGEFAKNLLPSIEKKPTSGLGSSPDIDKYLDNLNSEDITKPIGYKSGELTDPQYQVPNKPDSQWKRVKAGSNGATPDWAVPSLPKPAKASTQANIGIDPKQVKDAYDWLTGDKEPEETDWIANLTPEQKAAALKHLNSVSDEPQVLKAAIRSELNKSMPAKVRKS